MAVGDAHVIPDSLTLVLTQIFFPKPPTTFPTCFCRGENKKYAGKKVRLNRGSNSQPPGHESDTLTTEPPLSHPGRAVQSLTLWLLTFFFIYYGWHEHLITIHPNHPVWHIIYRGYLLFFSVKDRNLFRRVDTIGNIFTSGAATSENITDGVNEMN